MRCDSCGAQLPQGQTVCDYCGSMWDRVIPAPGGIQTANRNVFDQIKRSTAWTDRDSPGRQASLPQMPVLASVAPILFLVVFIGISGFIAITALGMAGIFGAVGFSASGPLGGGLALIPGVMALVPIGFVVVGLFMIAKHGKTMSDFQTAPTTAHAAVIVSKRTEVSGGGRNSSATTRYYLSAEFEDGRREEFAVMAPGLYGKVSEGDAGVLFVRSTYALDFDRLVT